jgi:UrcA family protein
MNDAATIHRPSEPDFCSTTQKDRPDVCHLFRFPPARPFPRCLWLALRRRGARLAQDATVTESASDMGMTVTRVPVKLSDLNLMSVQGRAMADRRVRAAARQACAIGVGKITLNRRRISATASAPRCARARSRSHWPASRFSPRAEWLSGHPAVPAAPPVVLAGGPNAPWRIFQTVSKQSPHSEFARTKPFWPHS